MTDRLQIDQPILRLVVEGRDFSGKAKTCQNQVVTARARMPKPIRCSGALLGGPHVQDSTATRVFLFSARRATDRSPRREPWVPPDTNIISPEGATHSALGQGRMSHELHIGCVAPQGLRGVSRPFPTAHAVGYDLPPSRLRTNSHRAFSENESDLLGRRHSKTATSPKHRMSQDQSSRPPACCGLAPKKRPRLWDNRGCSFQVSIGHFKRPLAISLLALPAWPNEIMRAMQTCFIASRAGLR